MPTLVHTHELAVDLNLSLRSSYDYTESEQLDAKKASYSIMCGQTGIQP